jgi:hypothetical protein
MTKRVCAYRGCGKSLDGKREHAIYCSGHCRMLAWKTRKKITGIRYVKASQNGSQRKPEQPRVRYDLAVEAAREAAGLFLASDASTDQLSGLAEDCVRKRLTPRQREQLAQRSERKAA